MITKNIVSFFESEEMPRETYALFKEITQKFQLVTTQILKYKNLS